MMVRLKRQRLNFFMLRIFILSLYSNYDGLVKSKNCRILTL